MLFLITSRYLAKGEADFLWRIQSAVLGGVDCVILREKDLDGKVLLQLSKAVRKIIEGSTARLIVHSDRSAAEAVEAWAVHHTFEDFRRLGKSDSRAVGVSIHSLEEAIEAERLGADYILASPIFETSCKPGAEPKGTAFLGKLKSVVKCPVIALGGICEANVEAAILSGANGIAVMSVIMSSENPKASARALKRKLNSTRALNSVWSESGRTF